MTDDLERLIAEIPGELKNLVDADGRTNREVVEAALWREFGGHRKAALERRIEEKQRRVEMIQSEKEQREQELESERTELEALRAKMESVEERADKQQAEIQRVVEKLSDAPRDPENPAIQKHAKELGITPEELVDELPENDGDSDLNSI
jgi:chromosome segregation ATPase